MPKNFAEWSAMIDQLMREKGWVTTRSSGGIVVAKETWLHRTYWKMLIRLIYLKQLIMGALR